MPEELPDFGSSSSSLPDFGAPELPDFEEPALPAFAVDHVPHSSEELGARNAQVERDAAQWLKLMRPGPGVIRAAPSTYETVMREIGSRLPFTGVTRETPIEPKRLQGGGAPPESPTALLSIPSRVAGTAGEALKAGLGDIAAAARNDKSEEGDFGGNVQAFLDHDKLPVERALELAKAGDKDTGAMGWQTVAADISLGLADLAPKVAMLEAAPGAGLVKAGEAADVFGFDKGGKFDTRSAAFAAAFPYVTKAAATATDAALQKAVERGFEWAGKPAAQRAVHVAANQVAMNAVMAVQDSPELIKLAQTDPQEFKRQLAKMIGSNLAFAIPEAMQSREPIGGGGGDKGDTKTTGVDTKFTPEGDQLVNSEQPADAAPSPAEDLIAQIRKQGEQAPAPLLDQDMAEQLRAAMVGNQIPSGETEVLPPENQEPETARRVEGAPDVVELPSLAPDAFKVGDSVDFSDAGQRLEGKIVATDEQSVVVEDDQGNRTRVLGRYTIPVTSEAEASTEPEKLTRIPRSEVIPEDQQLSRIQDLEVEVGNELAKKGVEYPETLLRDLVEGNREQPTPDDYEAGLRKMLEVLKGDRLPDSEQARRPELPVFEEAAPVESKEASPEMRQTTFEDWLDRAIDATDPLKGGKLLEGVSGAPVWLTKTLANGTLRAVRAALKAGRAISEAIEDGLAWLKDRNVEGFDADQARTWLSQAAGKDPVAKALQRLSDINARLNDLAVQDRRPGGLSDDQRRERHQLRQQATQLMRGLYTNPDYVGDVIHRLDQIGAEIRNARDAGNGAHARELGDEFEALSSLVEKNIPEALFGRVYNEMVARGEIMRPRWQPSPRAAAQAEASEEPAAGAEPGQRPAEEPPRDDRLPTALEELPERARNLFDHVRTLRAKLVARWRAVPNRDLISYLKDSADNIAVVFGKQSANVVLHELNRAFGARTYKDIGKRDALREMALTFAVEAGAGGESAPGETEGVQFGSGRRTLQEFREMILGSEHRNSTWARKALAAIRYADENWERLQPVARTYQALTDAQNASENNNGIRTLHRQGGYVFHLQDVNEGFQHVDTAGGWTGEAQNPGEPFRHVRSHATYAESIAAGVAPKSLSAVDLLQRRMTLGQRLINYGGWVDAMRQIVDPVTESPIVTEPEVRLRADGSEDVTAPPGYTLVNFAHRQVALHRGYAGLFNDLTQGSIMRGGGLREGMMKLASSTKHLVLFFDTFHLGRLAFWNAVSRTGLPTHQRGATILDNSAGDIEAMVRNGEIPADLGARMLEEKRKLDVLLQAGLNVGVVSDNLHVDWVQKLPVAGRFNKWLFEQYQRGAMSEVALLELERQRAANPELSESQVARKVARDVNTRFGNLGSQGWIKSKSFQDLARLCLLAPQWNESLIRAEAGAVRQVLGATAELPKGKFRLGMLGRSVGMAMLGQFLANQVINYFTRGKPTWENEEEAPGAKLSAWIPDVLGKGPGFFLNPMAIPAEITHLLWQKTDRSGGDFSKALEEFAVGRLNSLTRPVWTFFTRKDPLGRSLRTGKEVAGTMLSEFLPAPLSGSAVYRAGKQAVTGEHEEAFAGQFQKQLMQTFGIKSDQAPTAEQRIRGLVAKWKREQPNYKPKQLMQTFGIKSDQAPTAEQRIRGLVAKWKREQPNYKPNAEFFGGDYDELRHALQLGNMRDAAAALEDLRGKKTEHAIAKYMVDFVRHPFTGSTAKERAFLETLNPEQRKTYDRAIEERRDIRARFLELVDKHPAKGPVEAAAASE